MINKLELNSLFYLNWTLKGLPQLARIRSQIIFSHDPPPFPCSPWWKRELGGGPKHGQTEKLLCPIHLQTRLYVPRRHSLIHRRGGVGHRNSYEIWNENYLGLGYPGSTTKMSLSSSRKLYRVTCFSLYSFFVFCLFFFFCFLFFFSFCTTRLYGFLISLVGLLVHWLATNFLSFFPSAILKFTGAHSLSFEN